MPTASYVRTPGQQSQKLIWDSIVQLTDNIGTDEAKAIRVLLYLVLVLGEKSSFYDVLKCHVKSIRRLPIAERYQLPRISKGLPLFAFLYDTPANTNNLLPIFNAAQARGWRANVLTGEASNLRAGLNTGSSQSISVRQLVAVTTMKEKFATYRDAVSHLAVVIREFERHDRAQAQLIRENKCSLTNELALAMLAAEGLRQLYDLWEPSFVISTSNMWPFDCAVFDEAKRRCIPSFVIQHGVINHYWWPFVSTKMFIWGKSFENELLTLGAPSHQLGVAGMPASDHLFRRTQGRATAKKTAGLLSILVLSHTHGTLAAPNAFANFRTLITSSLAATPFVRWLIKLHPNENESFYAEMLGGRYPNLSILPKSTTLEDAVSQADVACTLWSTSGLEAMIMGLPLVVFDVDSMIHEYAWWPKCGGGSYASTTEDLVNFVNNAISDSNFLPNILIKQNQFLADNFANPGNAAQAILETIENTVVAPPGTTPQPVASQNGAA